MQVTPSSCESPRDDCQCCSHDFTYCYPISEIRSRSCESADQRVQFVLRQRRSRNPRSYWKYSFGGDRVYSMKTSNHDHPLGLRESLPPKLVRSFRVGTQLIASRVSPSCIGRPQDRYNQGNTDEVISSWMIRLVFTWRPTGGPGALTAAGSGEEVLPASDHRPCSAGGRTELPMKRPVVGTRLNDLLAIAAWAPISVPTNSTCRSTVQSQIP